MKNILLIAVLLGVLMSVTGQNVVQAEYFIDTDAGVGKNTMVALTNPQADGSNNLRINLTGVVPGFHKLYIRTKDGNNQWSITSRRNIEVIPSSVVKKMAGGEYFFDADPGFNAAVPVTISPQDSVTLQNFTAVTNGLPVGYHKLYIRLRDNDGRWSQTIRRNVEIINGSTSVIAGVEYFFNNDPGAGSARYAKFSNPAADGSFSFKIPVSAIPAGAHTFYLRARDSAHNNWSITQWQKDSVVTTVQSGKWSQPATWSNNKVPDANTVVLLYHAVDVDIVGAVCKSLTPYGANGKCTVETGKALKITGRP